MPEDVLGPAMARLERDIADGKLGPSANAELLEDDEHDFGYRLLVAERA